MAAQLAGELQDLLEIDTLEAADLVLIDDFTAFQSREEEILTRVEAGARAIFLELKPGCYEIGGSQVVVKNNVFNPSYFVSRRTGHPLVEGFEPHDFRYWYDPKVDRLAPLIAATFKADGFIKVLASGNMDEEGCWREALAVGERKYGKGSLVLCQVRLAGRTTTNPPARMFGERLVGGSRREMGPKPLQLAEGMAA